MLLTLETLRLKGEKHIHHTQINMISYTKIIAHGFTLLMGWFYFKCDFEVSKISVFKFPQADSSVSKNDIYSSYGGPALWNNRMITINRKSIFESGMRKAFCLQRIYWIAIVTFWT